MKDARDTRARVVRNRAMQVGSHVSARAGLEVELRCGRRAVDRIDALVRASFRGDEMTLTAWRVATGAPRAGRGRVVPADKPLGG